MADWKAHLKRAVDHCGSQLALARALNCSQAKINWLLQSADNISAEDALAVHRATGGDVSAFDLRPDLWRRPEDVPLEHPAEIAAS